MNLTSGLKLGESFFGMSRSHSKPSNHLCCLTCEKPPYPRRFSMLRSSKSSKNELRPSDSFQGISGLGSRFDFLLSDAMRDRCSGGPTTNSTAALDIASTRSCPFDSLNGRYLIHFFSQSTLKTKIVQRHLHIHKCIHKGQLLKPTNLQIRRNPF